MRDEVDRVLGRERSSEDEADDAEVLHRLDDLRLRVGHRAEVL